jgi:ribosomal protein L19
MLNLSKNIEFFNIGDIISVFTLREENIEEELYFIGLVTEKNLKHNSFKIMAHPLIEMKFSFFSPFIVQINLLKKQTLNFLQYKKKKKK